MKSIKLVVLVMFCVTINIFAQKKDNIEMGFQLGYNSSRVVDNKGNSSDYRRTFNLGATAEYYFSKSWGLKAKIIYDRKGFNNSTLTLYNYYGDGTSYTYRTDFEINYITIPVMANWHFGADRNWYLSFGFYQGFLSSARDTRLNNDLSKEFNSSDFGLALNVGVKFPLSDQMKLMLEYDYQGGISNIAKTTDGTNLTNNRGAFNVGLNFLLK